MMYLTEPRLIDVVKQQFLYKLNAYTGVFTSLLVMQLLGIFLSFENQSGISGSHSLMVTWSATTSDPPIGFTWLWAFSMGIMMTTITYRNDAFTFVTNRMSHHLSSFLFLLSITTIGGITAALSGSLIQFITAIRNHSVIIDSAGVFDSPYEFAIRIMTSILYTILFGGLGYLIGAFIQRSKLVIPLIFVVIFVLPYLQLGTDTEGFLLKIILFFGQETSFLLFLLKVIGTVTAFFTISMTITNEMEVRK